MCSSDLFVPYPPMGVVDVVVTSKDDMFDTSLFLDGSRVDQNGRGNLPENLGIFLYHKCQHPLIPGCDC